MIFSANRTSRMATVVALYSELISKSCQLSRSLLGESTEEMMSRFCLTCERHLAGPGHGWDDKFEIYSSN